MTTIIDPIACAVDQVTATPAAVALIETLRAEHGAVLFHQSGGCCDGSSPMCYPQDDFIVGDRDVRLGEIGEAPFYISASTSASSNRRERVRKRTPSPFSSENMPPRPGTTSMISWVCFQYSNCDGLM